VNKTSVDYIIVGQGLAGSCVALQLLTRDKKFIVVDEPSKNNCSTVAAGLFNPVTGKKLVKTWLADDLFPYLEKFYRRAEVLTGQKFYHEMPMYRPFISFEEQNEWMGRSAGDGFQNIISSVSTAPAFSGINDPLGGLFLKHSGYVDTVAFIGAVRKVLIENDAFRDSHFDVTEVRIEQSRVYYQGCDASAIIFCQGTGSNLNPFFKDLEIRPLKGETIRIKTDFAKQVIVNRGVYMVPGNPGGEWKVGSTYNVHDSAPSITSGARVELEEKLKELVRFPFEVSGQDWGIRPTTTDRRPLLGKHPKFEQFVIFNGLGTKGVSLAPYFSDALIQWMENPASALNKQVDVTRFKSLY
jgi:glycine oxidase